MNQQKKNVTKKMDLFTDIFTYLFPFSHKKHMAQNLFHFFNKHMRQK